MTTSTTTTTTSIRITGLFDDKGPATGYVLPGGITDDTTPTVGGTLSAALTSGQMIGIYDGTTTRLGYAVINGTNWIYTPTTALAMGPHTFVAKVEAGDGTALITSSDFMVTIDTLASPKG